MKKFRRRFFSALLALCLMCALLPPTSALNTNDANFPDVKSSDWFYEDLNRMYKLGIVHGHTDGYFRPNDPITRGQFITVLGIYEGMFTLTPSKGIHWAEVYWNTLNEARVLEKASSTVGAYGQLMEPVFPLTFESLEQPITRKEMSLLISNMLYNVFCKDMVKVNDIKSMIADYNSIDASYLDAIEQAYGQGIIAGYPDGNFKAEGILTRAEGISVVARLFFADRRVEVEDAESIAPTPEPDTSNFQSFAFKYRTMSEQERRLALFGDVNKTYFTSSADAADYMTTVTVPIWSLNTTTGVKSPAQINIQVHKLVAEEVKLIFQEIYNDPERFPMNQGVGGARFTDTMRHAWGCAIDINPVYNCECNTLYGYLQVTCGSGWWPLGTERTLYAGNLTTSSPFSIGKNPGDYGYSVVRAFAKYGWGWGGNWTSGTRYDFMHFSILPSGG